MGNKSNEAVANIIRIALAVITVIAILYGVYIHMFGGSFIGHKGDETSIGNISDEIAIDDKIESVNIDIPVAELTMCYGDKASVYYDIPKKYHPVINSEGGILSVKCNQNKAVNATSLSSTHSEIKITIPKGVTLKSCGVDLNVGSMDITGIAIDKITIDGDCGDIKLNSVNAGDIDIDCSIGDVKLDNVKANMLTIDEATGDVKLSGCEVQEVVVDSNLGDFEATGEYSKIKADCKLGEINITSDKSEEEMQLDLDVKTGSIMVNGNKYDK